MEELPEDADLNTQEEHTVSERKRLLISGLGKGGAGEPLYFA